MMRIRKLCVLFGVVALLSVPTLILAREVKEKGAIVVGGQPADPGEYPFMVALMNPNNSNGYSAYYCGGALIHPEWVVTAAHCLAGESSIDIGLGIYDLSGSEGERILVSQIIPHPNHNPSTSDNDIALLKLSSPANGYQLATYATSETQNAAGINAIATGWGALSQDGSYPTVLHEVDLPLISNNDCNAWSQNDAVTDNMLCAGYREGGKDTCQGDSGGPLFYYDAGIPVLVGATSWGNGCAKPNFPGVYARISYFAEWITSYVGDSNITPTPSPTTDLSATPTPTSTPTPTMMFTPTPSPVPEADAYENDNDANSASVISNGETQAHSILPAGDEDWLTFTLDTLSTVTLETSGPNGGDTYLFLYDSAGNEIDDNDDGGEGRFSFLERSCDARPLPAGTYTVMIREYSFDSTIANYDVSFNTTPCLATPEPTELPPLPTQDEYEVDDAPDSATTFADGETQTHSILPVGDEDWLTFTLADESAVSILTSGVAGDTRLYLYDATNNGIDANDDIISSVNLFSQIERTCDANPLPAGTYTILVDEYGNDDIIGSYDISLDVTSCSGGTVTETPTLPAATDTPQPGVDEYEVDDAADSATTLTDGETQTHSILPVGDEDWLTFALADESAVSVLTSGVGGDTRLYLYDEVDNLIDFHDDIIASVNLFSQIERTCTNPLPAGTYTILVDEYANNEIIDSYDISLDVTSCSGGAVTETPTLPVATDTPELAVDEYEGDETVEDASQIMDGEQQSHTISPTDDRDWLVFTITEESSVSLTTATDTGTVDMWVYNGNTTNGNLPVIGGFGEASQVTLTCGVDALPAGTYYVQIASDINDPNVGEYNVTLDTESCGDVPLTVTFSGAETSMNVTGWLLWVIVFVMQAAVLTFALQKCEN